MNRMMATFTTLLVVAALAAPVAAQNRSGRDAQGAGDRGGATGDAQKDNAGRNVFGDVLNSILKGGTQKVRGNVVVSKDGQLVVRSTDGRTYSVDTSMIDPQVTSALKEGAPVTLEVKRGDDKDNALTATALSPEQGAPKSFEKLEGAVQSVNGSDVAFKSDTGRVVRVDLSTIAGQPPALKANEPATLIYERTARSTIAAVWIEPKASNQPSAAVGSTATGTNHTAPASDRGRIAGRDTGAMPAGTGTGDSRGTSAPSRTSAGTGGYERIHGYVQSVGASTLSLKADDGRMLKVDTSQVKENTAQPGDVVSVVGKAGASDDQFVAEVIQKDR